MEGMAYGAGKAGGAFDPVTFFQQPHTILRIVSWLFSIVIFGCIANEGYVNRPNEVEEYCIFNRNQNACNYGVTIGSLAFLCCVAFLALDVYFPQISSVKDRKKAVLADVGVSGFWSFMWFVGFCFLANQWQVAKHEDNPLREGGDAARAAITFSFFSIFTWGALTLLSLERLKSVSFEEEYNKLFTPPAHAPASITPSPPCNFSALPIRPLPEHDRDCTFPRAPPPTQAGQAFLAFQRYKLGADSALFSQDYIDPSQDAATAPYSAYTSGGDPESPPNAGSYQQPNTEAAFDGSAGYQRQDY
ncbi:hypothetical protein SKAU_G00120600 [Synaphobranchus kaupii]|uniref:MARVEL domain-containing protein n=1 Tax=Synaphobranchus kaupii TaxID=118154 RepID=A0A9Q1J1D9_SYNKA|nr:hypothetical protein SKAU_G00120600 [Synaphobranchus kaupii]